MPRAGNDSRFGGGFDREWKMTNYRDGLILLLAAAGAGTDAIIILGFDVLTAAQTGNTILLAVAVARGNFTIGLSAGISVLAFLGGVVLGQLILSLARSRAKGTGLRRALGLQLGLLAGVIGLWHYADTSFANGVIALAAIAMGIQSAVVMNLHSRPTTYITGMLTTFATGLTRNWGERSRRKSPSAANAGTPDDHPWKHGVTWLVYGVSAVVTGWTYLQVGPFALLLPMAAIAAVLTMNPQRLLRDAD